MTHSHFNYVIWSTSALVTYFERCVFSRARTAYVPRSSGAKLLIRLYIELGIPQSSSPITTGFPSLRCDITAFFVGTFNLCNHYFLPYDAMRCAVSVIVILSVCLSVRLSVTLVDCVHMVRPTIMISSPYGSPIILVSGDIMFIPKFEGVTPSEGVE